MHQEPSSLSDVADHASLSQPQRPVRGRFESSWMLWVLGLLLVALIIPSVVSRIQYSITHAEEQAKVDVARANLHDFNLTQLSTSFRLVAQSVGPSVVSIHTHHGRGHGQGSGVIVDNDGYIVTNEHVVKGFRTCEIQLSDGRYGSASVIGTDLSTDMAVLKTEMDDLIAAPWGDSDELDVGDMVWAVGSPFGLQKSISFGIVSAKERRGRDITSGVYQEFLQTDAAVNPGNSGGPLVNSEGKIIGINTAIIGKTWQGVSLSIPSVLAREVYEKLRKDGWIERGYLGIEPSEVSDEHARLLGLERGQGVLVLKVARDTPADMAGLRRADVILSWGGQEFSDPTLMSRAIASTPIGSKIDVEILRPTKAGPKPMTFEVTIAAKPRDYSL